MYGELPHHVPGRTLGNHLAVNDSWMPGGVGGVTLHLRPHLAEACCLYFSMAERKQTSMASPSPVDQGKKSKNMAAHCSWWHDWVRIKSLAVLLLCPVSQGLPIKWVVIGPPPSKCSKEA